MGYFQEYLTDQEPYNNQKASTLSDEVCDDWVAFETKMLFLCGWEGN